MLGQGLMERRKERQLHELMKLYHLCCKNGLYREAEKVARTAHEVDPEDPAAEAAVHVAHQLAGKDRAHTARQPKKSMPTPAAPAQQPKPEGARIERVGKLMQQFHNLYKEGKYQEAEACARKALELDPDNPSVGAAVQIARIRRRAQEWRKSSAEKETFSFGDYELVPEADCTCSCPREKEIERRLGASISVNFKDARLEQVLDDIRDMSGLNVVVDAAALRDEGVSLDQHVSVKMDDVSLRSALNAIMQSVHLAFVVRDEALVVTTEAGARGKLVCRVYPIADLRNADLEAAAGRPGCCPGEGTGVDALITLITSSVAPQTWSEAGGPGKIDYFPLGMSLVVHQTPDVHEQLCDLLTALRRHLAERKAESKPDKD
jgi:tetratricopeptide (TPR) repeat protein